MWQNSKLAEIRWHCRRGMLELDALLLPFFEQHFLDLTDSEKQVFVALLSATDPELYAWLLGYEICEDEKKQALIKMIREKLNPQT